MKSKLKLTGPRLDSTACLEFTLNGRILFSPVSGLLRRLFYGTSLFSLIWETFRSLLFITITSCGVCRTCGYGCFVSRLPDVTFQSDL